MDVEFAYERGTDLSILYQRYYLLGLEQAGGVRVYGEPLATRGVPGVTRKTAILAGAAKLRGRVPGTHVVTGAGLCGRYRAHIDGQTVSFAIDARDTPFVRDQEALEDVDVFFKANAWPGRDYPPHVRSIVNGNGVLTARRIRLLRSLRNVEKTVDLVAIVRIWNREDIYSYEALARVDCSKRLLAVFPKGIPNDLRVEAETRLASADISWTERDLPPAVLWRDLARARVVFARPGKHGCFPWRTVDLLCMGACTVFDSLPQARWPVPLEPGGQVESAGIVRSGDDDGQHDRLTATVESLLADEREMARIRAEAATYYDHHAAPDAVARYLLKVVAER